MTTFDDREQAFEKKFAHDAEMQFKAEARRNKLLALWAAGLMDMEPEKVAGYVTEVIKSDFEEAGDEDVFRKVHADLGDRVSEADLRAKMAGFLVEAKAQIMAEA
ncbi:hypothetical protein FHS89_000648 [Rubricella aquisinus]|jgi:hypothetical protein|uniref:DUF1476 domain-containing protein n=1 Tax=Rubricella aquisinus TaxID=2028108 RepID=A0A840WLW8_9RHOB|nr:DUF1476 domain-containing protein [Rubricella aquisinus]MBB5514642.1 hypothetical protein [Rubricella aquisinus]